MDKRNEGSWDLLRDSDPGRYGRFAAIRSNGRTSAVYLTNKTQLFSTRPFLYDFAFNARNKTITEVNTSMRNIKKV